jgi:hypothetical protein
VSNKVVPASLAVDLLAAYTTAKGEPRSSRCEFQLPFCLACRMVAPLKNPTYPVTLDTNKAPPSLERVFPDLIAPAVAVRLRRVLLPIRICRGAELCVGWL